MRGRKGWGVVGSVLALGCTTAPARERESEAVLTLLHTSDLHSRALPFRARISQYEADLGLGAADSLTDIGGFARLATLLQREPSGLWIDSGDALEGAEIFHRFGGDVEVRLLSELGLAAQTLGNHELSLGAEDSARIDSHMEGIRALEMRLPQVSGPMGGGSSGGSGGTGSTMTGGECKTPEAPPMTIENMTARSQAMNRLIVAMLSCNLTRVYSHLWSGPRSDSTYPTLNLTGWPGLAKGDAAAARAIQTAYDRWISGFEEITRRARERFEGRDWRGAQADATARLALYRIHLDGAVADVSDILEDAVLERTRWAAVKALEALKLRYEVPEPRPSSASIGAELNAALAGAERLYSAGEPDADPSGGSRIEGNYSIGPGPSAAAVRPPGGPPRRSASHRA